MSWCGQRSSEIIFIDFPICSLRKYVALWFGAFVGLPHLPGEGLLSVFPELIKTAVDLYVCIILLPCGAVRVGLQENECLNLCKIAWCHWISYGCYSI